MPRSYTDTGTVQAELAPEALIWLLDHGPIWDNLDTEQAFTVRIEPTERELS